MGLERAFEAADLFGLSPLSRHALASRPQPADLGLTIPAQLVNIPRPAKVLQRFDPPTRKALADQLERALAPLQPHVAVIDSVRSLARDGALCVVAGQQPGLFGGPLFNTYKALHIARLARTLEEHWGIPVVPILWNHSDDHDIAEVHHAWFINQHLDLVKLNLPGVSSGRLPLSQLICEDERHQLPQLRARLSDLLANEPHADSILPIAVPKHGESLARAWTRFHLELFGHLGVVVVEPDWIRNECSESLAALVSPSPQAALDKAGERLGCAGLQTAIDPHTAALVFRVQDQAREALRLGGDGWRFDDEPGSRTAAELAAEIIGEKTAYNAGALLRPLVQDTALPVAAYVGGWGELAYHAQLGELRQERGLDPGVFVPRLSCTITDARTRGALRQLNQSAGDFLRGPQAPDEATSVDRHAVAERIKQASDTFHKALLNERAAINELDARLIGPLKHAAQQVRRSTSTFVEKLEHTADNAAGGSRRKRRRLESMLWPRQKPQERILTTAQMVARFGRTWIDELFEQTESLPIEHLLVHLDPLQ